MEKVKMRVRVMYYAHRIYRNSGREWPDSLKTAWCVYRCWKYMKRGPVKFYYKKLDGSYRCAFGRLHNLPKRKSKVNFDFNQDRLTYFDIEKHQFRCFKIENFLYYSKTFGHGNSQRNI